MLRCVVDDIVCEIVERYHIENLRDDDSFQTCCWLRHVGFIVFHAVYAVGATAAAKNPNGQM